MKILFNKLTIKKIALLLILTLFMSIITSCTSSETSVQSTPPENSKEDYVVAVVAPFTGDLARFGPQIKEGLELALTEINEKGVNGHKIVLREYDDRGDPTEAANIAQKIVNTPEIVAVIGSYGSSATFAMQPIYDKAKLLNITPTASHADLMKKSEYTFRLWSSVPEYQGYLADYVANTLKKSRVALFYVNNDWGKLCNNAIKESLTSKGVQIVAEEIINDGDKDFRSQVAKIIDAKPEMILAATYYKEGALLLNQLRNAGSNIPVGSTGVWMDEEFLSLAGKASEGVVMNSEFHPDKPDESVKLFMEKWKAKNGDKVPEQCVPPSFDAMNMLAIALEKAGIEDGDKLIDAFGEIKDFPGVTGNLTFGEDRELSKKTVYLEVKDGKFQVIKN